MLNAGENNRELEPTKINSRLGRCQFSAFCLSILLGVSFVLATCSHTDWTTTTRGIMQLPLSRQSGLPNFEITINSPSHSGHITIQVTILKKLSRRNIETLDNNSEMHRVPATKEILAVTVQNEETAETFTIQADGEGKANFDLANVMEKFVGRSVTISAWIKGTPQMGQSRNTLSAYELAEITQRRLGPRVFLQLPLEQKNQIIKIYQLKAEALWAQEHYDTASAQIVTLYEWFPDNPEAETVMRKFQEKMSAQLWNRGLYIIKGEDSILKMKSVSLVVGAEIVEENFLEDIVKHTSKLEDVDLVALYSYPERQDTRELEKTLRKGVDLLIQFANDVNILYFTRYMKTEEEIHAIKKIMRPYESGGFAEYKGACSFE